MQDSIDTASEPTSSISLREYGDVLRRRRAIILQTFVIFLVAGVLWTLFTPPTYRAVARLLLEPVSFQINQVNGSDPLADLFRINTAYSISTQVEQLQTDEIHKKVADALGRGGDLPIMSVAPLENTQIIEVASEGNNPEMTAQAPNKLLEIYVKQVGNQNGNALTKALNFAKAQAEANGKKTVEAERALSNFKNERKVIEFDTDKADQLKRVEGLKSAYADAQTASATAQARLNATITAQKSPVAAKTRNDLVSVAADPSVQKLQDDISNLRIQREVLDQTGLRPFRARFGRSRLPN